MTQARVSELLSKAVEAHALVTTGRYTVPRSWGVYKITPPKVSATRLHRIGNHPVRQGELEREFGSVNVVGLFKSRAVAEELSRLLNSGASSK
jgi:hypothetical protein